MKNEPKLHILFINNKIHKIFVVNKAKIFYCLDAFIKKFKLEDKDDIVVKLV